MVEPRTPKWLLDEAHAEQIMIFDPTKSYGESKAEVVSGFEREYVAWLLVRHSGNISAAAKEAKMDRKHLTEMAKRYGLRRPRPSGL